MGERLRIERVWLAWPHLYETHVVPGTSGTPKYMADFLIDSAQQAVADAVHQAYVKVLTDANKGNLVGVIQSPLKVGDQLNQDRKAKGKEALPEYENRWVIKARTTTAPAVVDRNAVPIPEATGKEQVINGSLVNGFIDLYYMSTGPNPGVFCGVDGVQLLDNVNRIIISGGGRPSVEDMFEVVPDAPAPVAPVGGVGPGPMPPGADTTPPWL